MIAEDISIELNMPRADAKRLVEEFFESVRHGLEHGKNIKLSGFGNFKLRDKGKRPGRNPKTGEEIPVEARRVVTFKPGLKLKNKIDVRNK
jgi:integration host factor subunit alpha